MENLIFSLNATIPIFLMMLLGMLFRKLGWMDEVFAAKMNKFVFLVPLPVLLFEQLATVDFSEVWDIKFILFCFMVTAISITISTLISLLWKDRSIKGEFIQATYRSSAALLGIAFIQNIYGTSAMGPLMIVSAVPLYNIFSVIVLTFEGENASGVNGKEKIKEACVGIAKNPIILGILAILIIGELRKMFRTVLADDCFVRENVVSLQRMGTYSFIIAIICLLRTVLYLTVTMLTLVLVFVIAGLFSKVLAFVFDKAIDYKEENDLTV